MKKEKTGYFGTYRHFRRDSGAATAACLIYANIDGTFDIRAGFSFCSPKDQFSRPEGRRIAAERLATNPVFIKNAKGIAPALIVHLRSIAKTLLLSQGFEEIGIAGYQNSRESKYGSIVGNFDSWFLRFLNEL